MNDFRIKCRIPGTKPRYSPVNFTREDVGQITFLQFSNLLVNMLAKPQKKTELASWDGGGERWRE